MERLHASEVRDLELRMENSLQALANQHRAEEQFREMSALKETINVL
jgi:hypothetical protein